MNCRHDEVPDNETLSQIAFASKSLSSTGWWYRNIERKALGILHRLKKFDHYCFAKEVYVITDHKPLVAMVSKDVATLSQWLQCIILHIYQYSMHILYKPGPELYVALVVPPQPFREQRPRNTGINKRIHTINTTVDLPICMSVEHIKAATEKDTKYKCLKDI